jgi:hypothetical protein
VCSRFYHVLIVQSHSNNPFSSDNSITVQGSACHVPVDGSKHSLPPVQTVLCVLRPINPVWVSPKAPQTPNVPNRFYLIPTILFWIYCSQSKWYLHCLLCEMEPDPVNHSATVMLRFVSRACWRVRHEARVSLPCSWDPHERRQQHPWPVSMASMATTPPHGQLSSVINCIQHQGTPSTWLPQHPDRDRMCSAGVKACQELCITGPGLVLSVTVCTSTSVGGRDSSRSAASWGVLSQP